MSDLERAQPGDRVVVSGSRTLTGTALETVERVTDKQVVTDSSRYWKKSGHRVGAKSERGGFGASPRARLATDEDIKRISAERARWSMARREFWSDMPDDKVLELYREAVSAKEGSA